MAKYVKLEDLMQFPIRLSHYDKNNGNEHFVFGIESVLEYAQNLPTIDLEGVSTRYKDLLIGALYELKNTVRDFGSVCETIGITECDRDELGI